MNKEQINNKFDELKEWVLKEIEDVRVEMLNELEVKEPDKLDRPEKGQDYWYVDDSGDKYCGTWGGNEYNIYHISQGNCFWGDYAEERCKGYQTALQTQGRIRELGGKTGVPEFIEWWCELYFYVDTNSIQIDHTTGQRSAYFWFGSYGHAEKAKKEIGQEALIHMVKNGVAL